MALTTKRIIALPSQTDPQEGDYLAIDNATGGTHKIPAGRIGVEVDDTLTEQGKAADAKATGDALDEIRSQIEVTGTASGAIATFADGADMPAKSVIVNIEPQQAGSGTPSPDNVRTISGWESVSVNVTGVNVWDEEWELGYYDTSGQPVSGNSSIRSKNYIKVVPNTTYHAKGTPLYVCQYDADKNFIGTRSDVSNGNFITLTNARYIRFNMGGAYGATYNHDISINYPSTDTDYHAYNGTTTTTNLGRTVYGGTLDVVSGELTVDKGFATFDGSSDETWFNNGSVGVYTPKASLPNVKPIWSGVTILSNQYTQVVSGPASTVNGTFNWNDSMNALQFRNDNALNATDFRAALSQNPVTIVYPLAEPQTYQLTPTEIKTLLGENNVWADSGDVEVVYIRDLNIAINNLLNSNGTRSLGMMAMSAPTDEQTEEPAEDDMR